MDLDKLQLSPTIRLRIRRFNKEYLELARELVSSYPAAAPLLGITQQAADALAHAEAITCDPICQMDLLVATVRITNAEFWVRAAAGALDANQLLHAFMATIPAEFLP
ncbi:MAG TPA: hypothetical protein VNF69_15550 [Burkholderiales bacterium]|nr:hypothetical protein [Burkholderiales bacterium]